MTAISDTLEGLFHLFGYHLLPIFEFLSLSCKSLASFLVFIIFWIDWFFYSGPDNLDNLRKIAEQFQKQAPSGAAATAPEDNDDDVPQLVPGENFEQAADEKETA